MVIILSIEESENEIVAGFPEYVILSTNTPATIFYTLDGTDPTEDSDIFVDRITLPTDGLMLTLKAVATSGSFSSSILEQTYYTDSSDLGRSRLIGKEGINILPPGSEVVDHFSYNQDGDFAQTSSISFEDIDFRASTTNNIGEDISGDTTIDFINFKIEQPILQDPLVSYLNSNSFDPKAAYIIMDGSSSEELNDQAVRIINRPHGSMDSHSRIHNQNSPNYQLVTANFVRYMINPNTGKITFYYRDSRENRWIQSTQVIEPVQLDLTPKTKGPPSSFVFRWIEDRAQSKIY